jgi:hypothetical protein
VPASVAIVRISRLGFVGALAAASAVLGAEQDSRLRLPPMVSPPHCDEPAPYHSEYWNSRVLGFLIVYRQGVDAKELTERLAQQSGFTVLVSRADGFTVSWLKPEQVASLRCILEVKIIEFVLPTVIAGI